MSGRTDESAADLTSGTSRVTPQRGYGSTRLVFSILATLLSRVGSVLIPLLLVPVVLSYLGAAQFGLWMAITAMVGLAAFADLGLGNGLMTRLAPCNATNDVVSARRYIASAYAVLASTACVLCVVTWAASSTVPWAEVLHTRDDVDAGVARLMTLSCLTIFILNIPLSLVTRIQYAYQMVTQCNIWQLAGNVASLPLTLLAVHYSCPAPLVVASATGGPLLANLAASAWFYTRQRRDLVPKPRDVDLRTSRDLFALGGQFFALTVVMAVAVNADPLIVAHSSSLDSVTAYAIPARVFAQLGALITTINAPLWPAHGTALAHGDVRWVRRITNRMTIVSVTIVVVAAIILLSVGQLAIPIWIGSPFDLNVALFLGLALWWAILAAISPRFMAQNAAGVLRPQIIGWVLYMLASVPLKFYGATKLGIAAIPFVGVGVYLSTVIPSALVGYRKTIRGNTGEPPAHHRSSHRLRRTSTHAGSVNV